MENWSADNRIELSGRDIEQLDMEVNGKQIGSLGGGDRRIKKSVDYQGRIDGKKVRTTTGFPEGALERRPEGRRY